MDNRRMKEIQRLPLVYDEADESDPAVIRYLSEIDRRWDKVTDLLRRYPRKTLSEIHQLADEELANS